MLAMHFGHPDPEMRPHDATASWAAIRPASAATPHAAGRHGSHSDSTARCVGCCARRRAPIAGSSSRRFAPSMTRRQNTERFQRGPINTLRHLPVQNAFHGLLPQPQLAADIAYRAIEEATHHVARSKARV
jgi:hypothetical protein